MGEAFEGEGKGVSFLVEFLYGCVREPRRQLFFSLFSLCWFLLV